MRSSFPCPTALTLLGVLAFSPSQQAEAKPRDQEARAETLPVEVYHCTIDTYEPWIRRSARPRDYNPYSFSAHVEVFIPELGVAYVPSSGSFIAADRTRYAAPAERTVKERFVQRTTKIKRMPELTLTPRALREVRKKHIDLLERQASKKQEEGRDK